MRLLLGLIVACWMAGAVGSTVGAQELRLGMAEHDITNTEDGYDLQAQVVFGPRAGPDNRNALRPYLTAGTNTDGYLSTWGAGIGYERAVLQHWVAEFQAGIVGHDGRIDLPPPQESARRREVLDTEITYGCDALFQLIPAVGRSLGERVRVSAYWEHLSHGQILCDNDKNEGLDSYGLRVGFAF